MLDKSLLQYAYFQYEADIPHENIIQALVTKGVDIHQAQLILDTATVIYCTNSLQPSQEQHQPESQEAESMGIEGILKLIISLIGIGISVAQCSN